MGNIEIGPCSVDEYIRSEESRLMEDQLCVDSLYTWVGLFEGAAFKNPSRIEDIERHPKKPAFYIVKFAILDEELNPDITSRGLFCGGIYQHAQNSRSLIFRGFEGESVMPLKRGFFKEFHEIDEDYVETGLANLRHYLNSNHD